MSAPTFLTNFVEGDVPANRVLAIIGPPGCGKTVLTYTMAADSCRLGLPCVYMVTDRPPVDVRNSLDAVGVKGQSLVVIDAYTAMTGEQPEEQFSLRSFGSPSDLSILVATVLRTVQSSLFVLDSVSALLNYVSEETATRFLPTLVARLRLKQWLSLMVFESGIHSEAFYNNVRAILDGVMEFKLYEVANELQRAARLSSFKGVRHHTRWLPLQVTEDGLMKVLRGNPGLKQVSVETSKQAVWKV